MLEKIKTLFEVHRDSRANETETQKRKLSRLEVRMLMENRRALRGIKK